MAGDSIRSGASCQDRCISNHLQCTGSFLAPFVGFVLHAERKGNSVVSEPWLAGLTGIIAVPTLHGILAVRCHATQGHRKKAVR